MKTTYDVFISYSRKDYLKEDEQTPDPEKIVSKILTVLDANNISYWIDKKGMYSSAQFTALIEDQIFDARCFLFVSTQASNASTYTLGEVFTAVEYRKPIIPFRADDSKFGKGIGFHLRPLDHIEYFKTGEEAFIKLVDSVKHIKAEQLSDQLVAEYNSIVAEYKAKLHAKSKEMQALGINPPANSFGQSPSEGEIKKIRFEYEAKLVKLQEEKDREIASLRKELTEKLKAQRILQSSLDSRCKALTGDLDRARQRNKQLENSEMRCKQLERENTELKSQVKKSQESEVNAFVRVRIDKVGPQKLSLVKSVKELFELDIHIARRYVDNAPSVLPGLYTRPVADFILKELARSEALLSFSEGDSGWVKFNPQYNVVILSSGPQKLQVVKVVKEMCGLGLAEAKNIVDNVPARLPITLSSLSVAHNICAELKQIGVTAKVESE